MNKLKLSRLCAAADIYYKKAQAPAVTRDLLMTMLTAFTNELPAKKQQYADNDPKKAAYDAAIKIMKEAFSAAEKNDWNTVNNAVSYSIFNIKKSGVYDKSFEEYAGNFMRNISEFRKQPSESTTKPVAEQVEQTTQTPVSTAPGKAAPAKVSPNKSVMNYEGPIDPKIQQILVYNFKKDLGKNGPKGDGVDGKLGSRTRQAINEIRDGAAATKGMNDRVFFAHLLQYYTQPTAKSTPTESEPMGGRMPRGRTGII